MIRLKNLLVEGEGKLTGQYIETAKSLANALISRGFSKIDAAAIVGNMWAESTFKPTAKGSGGDFGLVQWLGPRKKALKKFAKDKKKSINDLNTQLDFLKYELLDSYNGEYGYETHQFKKAMAHGKTAADKAAGFAIYVERPRAGALSKSLPTRKAVAQQIFNLIDDRDDWGRPKGDKWYGFNPKTKSYEQGPNKGKSLSKTKSKTNNNTYIVKSGDSLSVIAQKYDTTVDTLKQVNNLKTDTIKIGQKLIIKKPLKPFWDKWFKD